MAIPRGLPWTAGTDEFDATLRRSWGHDLGITHVGGARAATADDLAGLPARAAAAIATADRLLANVDRTAGNPDLLARPDGGLAAIDHDGCLFLGRALEGRPGSFGLPRGHLRPRAGVVPPPPLPRAAAPADLPDDWIAAAGTDRATLLRALEAYGAAARAALGAAGA